VKDVDIGSIVLGQMIDNGEWFTDPPSKPEQLVERKLTIEERNYALRSCLELEYQEPSKRLRNTNKTVGA
jgi:hypothetical protein